VSASFWPLLEAASSMLYYSIFLLKTISEGVDKKNKVECINGGEKEHL
jgi:hypothetical protein